MSKFLSENERSQKASLKIEIIQVLRGIAAIMVLCFHLKELLKPDDILKKVLDLLFNSGAAGVDLFFIISGFIMVYVTQNTTGGLKPAFHFLYKRALRIWPLYCICTLTYALILSPKITILSKAALTEIALSLSFIPLSYSSPPFFGYAFLGTGWSLNYEMYFYLLLTIALLFGKQRWLIFSVLIAVTLILLPLSQNDLTARPLEAHNFGNKILNLITNPIIWEFVYGCIIGLLYINKSTASILEKVFRSKIILASVLIYVLWENISGFYGGHGPFYWGATMASLFLSLIFFNSTQTIKYAPWLVHLGNMSFSIYLWHIPVSAFFTQLFDSLSLQGNSTGTAAFLLIVSATLIISNISYLLIEKRLHNFIVSKIQL